MNSEHYKIESDNQGAGSANSMAGEIEVPEKFAKGTSPGIEMEIDSSPTVETKAAARILKELHETSGEQTSQLSLENKNIDTVKTEKVPKVSKNKENIQFVDKYSSRKADLETLRRNYIDEFRYLYPDLTRSKIDDVIATTKPPLRSYFTAKGKRLRDWYKRKKMIEQMFAKH